MAESFSLAVFRFFFWLLPVPVAATAFRLLLLPATGVLNGSSSSTSSSSACETAFSLPFFFEGDSLSTKDWTRVAFFFVGVTSSSSSTISIVNEGFGADSAFTAASFAVLPLPAFRNGVDRLLLVDAGKEEGTGGVVVVVTDRVARLGSSSTRRASLSAARKMAGWAPDWVW